MERWKWLAVAMCLWLSAGCAGTAILSVGPTVDTEGNPGFDVILSGGFGMGGETAFLATAFIGGGMGDAGLDGMLYGGADFGLRYRGDDDIGLRGALGYASRRFFTDQGQEIWHGALLRTDLTYTFIRECTSGSWFKPKLGMCTSGNLALGVRMEVHGGPGVRGWFSFPVSVGLFRGAK